MSCRDRLFARASTFALKKPGADSRLSSAPVAHVSSTASIAQAWSLAARRAGYNVHTLAQVTNVHIRQIERFCRNELGRSPQEWLNEQRIIAARTLLLERESIKHVAMELGFKQPSHFCRQFKKCYGMTPSEFLLFHQQLNRRLAEQLA